MKPYLALLALLILAGTTTGMNFTEQAYYQGILEGYHLGAIVIQGQSDPSKESEYNGRIADLNTWLESVGYYDFKWANLQKNEYVLPPIFDGPMVIVNESNSSGIIHAIDGNAKAGTTYTTNDMNLLPDPQNMTQIKREGGDYLGGV